MYFKDSFPSISIFHLNEHSHLTDVEEHSLSESGLHWPSPHSKVLCSSGSSSRKWCLQPYLGRFGEGREMNYRSIAINSSPAGWAQSSANLLTSAWLCKIRPTLFSFFCAWQDHQYESLKDSSLWCSLKLYFFRGGGLWLDDSTVQSKQGLFSVIQQWTIKDYILFFGQNSCFNIALLFLTDIIWSMDLNVLPYLSWSRQLRSSSTTGHDTLKPTLAQANEDNHTGYRTLQAVHNKIIIAKLVLSYMSKGILPSWFPSTSKKNKLRLSKAFSLDDPHSRMTTGNGDGDD